MSRDDPRWRGALTPVPEPLLRDFDTMLQRIRGDVSEIKPQIKETHEGFIVLQNDMKHMSERVKGLEAEDKHGCIKEETLSIVESTLQEVTVKSVKVENGVLRVCEDLKDIRASSSKLIYWLLGVIILALSGLIGWVVTVATMNADVRHINQTLQDVKTEQRALMERVIKSR